MSAREELIEALTQGVAYSAEYAGLLVDNLLEEEAEKLRSHIPYFSMEATWQRHVLYGLAGETTEAQTALDALGEAIIKSLANVIDPYAKGE